MQRIHTAAAAVAVICLFVAGCGEGKLRTQGRVLRGGQPLIPKEGESVRVTFVPIPPDGTPPTDHYHCEYNRSDATFRAAGKDLKVMPPGKYRVAVEFKKNRQDEFRGRYDENNSPFVFDVDEKTGELVIDLPQ